MRFVPVSCLREGMVVAKDLFDKNGQLLIKWGTELKKYYISRIEELGYQGVYINDDISKDIVIESVISEELRYKAIQTIKDGFTSCSIYNDKEHKTDMLMQATCVVQEIVDEILNNNVSVINLIDLKFFDEYTYSHSVNVCILSIILGYALGLDKNKLWRLGLGAILHDIGKVFIDKDILNKEGKLTKEEYEIIKKHPFDGFNYLKDVYNVLPTVYRCVLDHHERYDGQGYPNKIKGDSISQFGRIVCITDVYDALTSNRPYRTAVLPSEAMEYIMGNSGMIFDPFMVKMFVKKVAAYPVGTIVKLSNNYTGIVVENYEECCLRPKIKVFKDPNNKEINEVWNLAEQVNYMITIVEVVSQ